MAQYRLQVNLDDTSGLPRNVSVNTLYVDTDLDVLGTGGGAGSLTADCAALWNSVLGGFISGAVSRFRVTAYKMSDPKPRRPVAESIVAHTGVGSGPGPREVALCLSYYAGSNVPARRGRMYIGPWTDNVHERPGAGQLQALGDLAAGISALGGANVQWVQYSPHTGDFTNVSHWWVDNEWDVQRRRRLGSTGRIQGDVSG